jgi:hypothetical protein
MLGADARSDKVSSGQKWADYIRITICSANVTRTAAVADRSGLSQCPAVSVLGLSAHPGCWPT